MPGREGCLHAWGISPAWLSLSSRGAEGTACQDRGDGGPGSTDMCRMLSSQPLPDNSALLMNQSTLKQLPETARQRQLHAFKICKKFQVGDGVAGCVLCSGGGALHPWSLWLLPTYPVAPSATPVLGAPEFGLSLHHGTATCCSLVGSDCPAAHAARSPRHCPCLQLSQNRQLCMARPGKPRQRGAGTTVPSLALSLPCSPCSLRICWMRTAW